jgi:hypothetical protein
MGRDKVITVPPRDNLRSWPRRRAPGQLHRYIISYQEQSHGGCTPDADFTPQGMEKTPSQAERSSNWRCYISTAMVQDATAQQTGGSFGKILGLLAVLSKDGGSDEAKVET